MNDYVVLLRGINVGGRNKVPMAELRACLEELGFTRVRTYIASGNVVLASDDDPATVAARIERALPERFALDVELVRVHVLPASAMRSVVADRPPGFGDEPDTYHCDVIFLMGVTAQDVLGDFSPREGVDRIWPGDGVVYSQRLSELRTKSRLNRIAQSPHYGAMTVRNWRTTATLVSMLDD